jgi:glutathione S-transferase
MKIHVFPLSGRVVGVVALKNYLALDRELKPIDLGRGD